MSDNSEELKIWLINNSSGVYRKCVTAANYIRELEVNNKALKKSVNAYKLYGPGATTESDNALLTAKVKELEKGHEADVRQINYLDQREVELINKIAEFVKGTKFGVADVLASSIAERFIKMGGRHQLTTNRGEE